MSGSPARLNRGDVDGASRVVDERIRDEIRNVPRIVAVGPEDDVVPRAEIHAAHGRAACRTRRANRIAPVPDLAHLAHLPCCHPCNPLPDPGLKGADGTWPPAMPAQAPAIKEEKLEQAPIPRKSD